MQTLSHYLRKKTAILALLAMYAIIIIVYVYPATFNLIKEYSILIVGILSLIAAFIAYDRLVHEQKTQQYELSDYKRLKSKETHPIFYEEINKNVTIYNTNGDAEISYEMLARNTSGDFLPQLIHTISYNGILDSCSAKVNDQEAEVEFKQFAISRIVGETVEPIQERQLKIIFHLGHLRIDVGELFSYNYRIKARALFAKIMNKRGEYSSYHVMHPARLLNIRVMAPEGCSFVKEGISIEIKDKHEVSESQEEKRCRELCRPQILAKGQMILWTVIEPRIACNYRVYFEVSKSCNAQ